MKVYVIFGLMMLAASNACSGESGCSTEGNALSGPTTGSLVSAATQMRFGVMATRVPTATALELNIPVTGGLLVMSVATDSIACKAGLRQGDVIVKFGDKAVADVTDLQKEVSAARPGSAVPVTIKRKGVGSSVVTVTF